MISFFVPGIPKPQGSKRGFVVKGKAVLVESAGTPLKDWRAVVALAAREAWGSDSPHVGPLEVNLTFYLPRPKSHPKRVTWPATRPDIDKLSRSILDALTHICWSDDGQVISLNAQKVWAQPDRGIQVGCRIEVEDI